MIDKRVATVEEAVAGIRDGATILIGGFGDTGTPFELIHAVLDTGARDLTIVSNNAGNGYVGIAALLEADRVRRVVCSYPRSSDCVVIDRKFREGKVEIELVPQGTLVERMRCAGAGLYGFYTRTAAGTPLVDGKEERIIDGVECVLEKPLRGDVALIKATCADRWGNLVYSKTARNFGPIMATAADLTVVQVSRVVGLGELDPELIGTPGIFVDRIVEVGGAS
ncbi:3-oxoacid CoA-transferase subunit A [Geobacter sp.]|uniref:3-oxoacid CoA-transferase subunit A n=1 Tax=Geobacter sp. TaxID=46610 RepID=UPI00262A9652|nr:3-oxoacid CoA-transferase subunit A [Geobacter sp.]